MTTNRAAGDAGVVTGWGDRTEVRLADGTVHRIGDPALPIYADAVYHPYACPLSPVAWRQSLETVAQTQWHGTKGRLTALAAWMTDELPAILADAERYRFLRDNPIGLRAIDGNAGHLAAWPEMDRHVDAARAATEGGGA